MKKTLYSIILILGYVTNARSQAINNNQQIAYYDALFLKKYISWKSDVGYTLSPSNYILPEEKILIKLRDSAGIAPAENKKAVDQLTAIKASKKDSIFSLLVQYKIIDKNDLIDATKLKTAINSNPLFASLKLNVSGMTQASSEILSLEVKMNNAVSFLGGVNVTNVASGVSSFLVKRAKEELFIAIIEKLKDTTKFPELPKLFPKTIQLLNSFDTWQYSNVLNTLKEAFDKDLQQLLVNIPELNKLPICGDIYNTYDTAARKRVKAIKSFFDTPEAHIYLSALQIGNGIISGQKLPDVINTISGNEYLGNIPNGDSNIKNAIKLINILSLSIENTEVGKDYISVDAFANLSKDPAGSTLFWGLLYQQLKNQSVELTIDGHKIILADLIQNDVAGTTKYFNDVLTSGADLRVAINNLSNGKKRGEKDLTTYWAAIIESSKRLFQASINISLIDPALPVPPKIKEFTNDAVQVLTIANDIFVRNYSAAVVDFSGLIPDDVSHANFKNFFVKYGSFIANIVQAQNADDVENAIEAIALPVGSFTIKQHSNYNISLNGYIGYGYDFSYAQSIYAPIGVSFSTKYKSPFDNKTKPHYGAISIFISVFDVGSIVAYQLNNTTANATTTNTGSQETTNSQINTSASNQQIKLGSIFAPGIEGFIEIPKTPFAIGGGVRRTPTLFYSNSSTYSTVGAKWKCNLAVLIDIPLFTLFNRTGN